VVVLAIPRFIIAGDTVSWRDSAFQGTDPVTAEPRNFTPDLYTLQTTLKGVEALPLLLIAVADAGQWLTTLTAAQSALLPVGLASVYVAVVSQNSDRKTVATTQIEVLPNLATVPPGYEGRSTAQQQLELVDAAITTLLAGGAVQSYSIKGRSLSRYSLAELRQLQAELKIEISRQQGRGRNLLVKFGGYP
jgi:hypothetical protein